MCSDATQHCIDWGDYRWIQLLYGIIRKVLSPSYPGVRPPVPPSRLQQGFKDALVALAALKNPEMEPKGAEGALRDLVFNFMLVRPELERVKEMAWLHAKVRGLTTKYIHYEGP